MDPSSIRTGIVCYVDNFPPLDDFPDKVKRRRVIVVFKPQPPLSEHVPVACVGVTTRDPEDDESLRVPSSADVQNCETSFTDPSWAIPRWVRYVAASSLEPQIGYVGGPTLKQLKHRANAYLADAVAAGLVTKIPVLGTLPSKPSKSDDATPPLASS